MTISSEDELNQAQEEIQNFEKAILEARSRLAGEPKSLRAFTNIHRRQIRQLRDEINEFLGMDEAIEAPVVVRFGTEDEGMAPRISELDFVMDRFRRAAANIADYLVRGELRSTGRPPADIAEQVDLRLVGISQGSTRLHFEFPPQRSLEEEIVVRSLNVMEDVVKAVENPNQIPASLEDEEFRRYAIRQLKKLAPGPRSRIRFIEISKGREGQWTTFSIDSSHSAKAREYIDRGLPTVTISVRGNLRAIDLDAGKFKLRNREDQVFDCTVPEDLKEDALRYIADQIDVEVRGTREVEGGPIEVADLEPLESVAEEE